MCLIFLIVSTEAILKEGKVFCSTGFEEQGKIKSVIRLYDNPRTFSVANIILAQFSCKLPLGSKFAEYGKEIMCLNGGLVP